MEDKEKYLIQSIETKMKLVCSMAQHFGCLQLLNEQIEGLLKTMEETAAQAMEIDETSEKISKAFRESEADKK